MTEADGAVARYKLPGPTARVKRKDQVIVHTL